MSSERSLRRRRRDKAPRPRDARPRRSSSMQLMVIISRTVSLLIVLFIATVGAQRVARSILGLTQSDEPALGNAHVPPAAVTEARRSVLRAVSDAERAAVRATVDLDDANAR